MILFKSASEVADYLQKQQSASNSVGFVPTMGALHEGHISLIGQSKKENSLTATSIFVNPTQFNNPEDFKKYPITIEKDIDALERSGCDILFMPGVEEIYPPGLNKPNYDLGYLETVLEGKYRPGHFQGVCQVVDRLLQIIHPNRLYLGQKDYQQCMVIKKLTEIKNFKTDLVICPTLRETDGLAMSSRNMRLNAEERKQAVSIYDTLILVKNGLVKGSLKELQSKAHDHLSAAGFKIDYIEIADASNLSLLETWDGKTSVVVLIAAYLNDIRLIDNMVIS